MAGAGSHGGRGRGGRDEEQGRQEDHGGWRIWMDKGRIWMDKGRREDKRKRIKEEGKMSTGSDRFCA